MYRGSTPKFTFPINVPINSISDFVLTFSQHGKTVLQKTLDDCEVYTEYDSKHKKTRNIISIRLTVDESFLFEPATQLHIQLRGLLEDGIQVVTRELTTYVYDTLYDGPFCKVSYKIELDSELDWMQSLFDAHVKPDIANHIQEDTHLYKKGEIVNLPELPEQIHMDFGTLIFQGVNESDIVIGDESEKIIVLSWKPVYDFSHCGYFYPGTETNFYSASKDWTSESRTSGELILDNITDFTSLYKTDDCIQFNIYNNNHHYGSSYTHDELVVMGWPVVPFVKHFYGYGTGAYDILELSIEDNELSVYAEFQHRDNHALVEMCKLEYRDMYLDSNLTKPNLMTFDTCIDLFTGKEYKKDDDGIWKDITNIK